MITASQWKKLLSALQPRRAGSRVSGWGWHRKLVEQTDAGPLELGMGSSEMGGAAEIVVENYFVHATLRMKAPAPFALRLGWTGRLVPEANQWRTGDASFDKQYAPATTSNPAEAERLLDARVRRDLASLCAIPPRGLSLILDGRVLSVWKTKPIDDLPRLEHFFDDAMRLLLHLEATLPRYGASPGAQRSR